jgi:hypothetical protein
MGPPLALILVRIKVTDDAGLAALLDRTVYKKQCEKEMGG